MSYTQQEPAGPKYKATIGITVENVDGNNNSGSHNLQISYEPEYFIFNSIQTDEFFQAFVDYASKFEFNENPVIFLVANRESAIISQCEPTPEVTE